MTYSSRTAVLRLSTTVIIGPGELVVAMKTKFSRAKRSVPVTSLSLTSPETAREDGEIVTTPVKLEGRSGEVTSEV